MIAWWAAFLLGVLGGVVGAAVVLGLVLVAGLTLKHRLRPHP